MPLDAEYLVDRRRLRRSLSVWRVTAFVLAALVLVGLGITFAGPGAVPAGTPHIARVSVEGLIVNDRDREKMLRRMADADSVRAVILYVNSPGGSTTASEELFNAVREIAHKKPVVTLMGTTAASGGYIAALAGDHVVAHRTSLTGSIGVLAQWPNVTGLLDSIGVDMQTVKSGPLKAEPNPFEPTSDEAREALRAAIMDSYEWFLTLVMERRGLDDAAARAIGDGRIFTGGQAAELGLVDEVGDESVARGWLEREHGILRTMRVRDWEVDRGFGSLGLAGLAGVARLLGLEGLARQIARGFGSDLGLDGVIALWHPQLIEE
ncbi:signal peptide peptidase SppA [Lutibaculum baratangense]|uniref:Signal peptide peptidase SppA, 36K type n=1 Tax=Lutibaculum baratangense AMV1 TaxID=631454 RepID=V4TJ34_9HYPH|nr:signal peptide peptidase SppA [Lutibaculum baratangense]ESR25933.1 signal peptide peptidase SppA, 36K type [Lutibaculum baratangense AMV1]